MSPAEFAQLTESGDHWYAGFVDVSGKVLKHDTHEEICLDVLGPDRFEEVQDAAASEFPSDPIEAFHGLLYDAMSDKGWFRLVNEWRGNHHTLYIDLPARGQPERLKVIKHAKDLAIGMQCQLKDSSGNLLWSPE